MPAPTIRLPFSSTRVVEPPEAPRLRMFGRLIGRAMVPPGWGALLKAFEIWGMRASRSFDEAAPVAITSSRPMLTTLVPVGATPRSKVPVTTTSST
ncbi:hypothetical protein D3C87_1036950 [compost metagenome]